MIMDVQQWDLLTSNPTCLDLFHGDNLGIWETFSLKLTVRTRKLVLERQAFPLGAVCLFSGAMLVLGSVVAVPLIGYIMTIPI